MLAGGALRPARQFLKFLSDDSDILYFSRFECFSASRRGRVSPAPIRIGEQSGLQFCEHWQKTPSYLQGSPHVKYVMAKLTVLYKLSRTAQNIRLLVYSPFVRPNCTLCCPKNLRVLNVQNNNHRLLKQPFLLAEINLH